MKRRILNKKGLTLAEMLVAVAILTVFISMAAFGMSGLFGAGGQMAAASKAAVLGADALEIVASEVRLGGNFGEGGTELHYDSASYGEDCTLAVEEGRIVVIRTDSTVDASGRPEEERKVFRLLGEASYGDVAIGAVTFTKQDGGAIAIELEVADAGGTTLWSNTATVVPLRAQLGA